MKNFYLLILLLVSFSCTDVYDDFPVPPASTVPQFSFEIINPETREVSFTNTSIVPSEAGNATYTWSFGDGTTSGETSPTHTFSGYGEYEVKLVIITTLSGIKESTTTITLLQPIDIDFTLYFMDTDFTTIRAVGETTLDIELGTFGSGLAIDPLGKKLYFVDDDNYQIKRANLDGSNIETLYENLTGATNLTLDLENQRIFWSNRADGTVHRGRMDGSGEAETIINSLSLPEGIAYHNGKIYISDVQEPPIGENIYRANANGSALEVFVAGSWGYGLAIDPINERLYFDDQGVYDDPADNRLRSVSLNENTDINVIATVEPLGANGSRAYGITIDTEGNKCYWTDRTSRKIKRANLDGSVEETLLIAEGSPRGIAIFK